MTLVMSVDVVVETVIHRPRDVVSAFACDPENAPRWYVNITEARWVSAPGVVVGARAAFVARFLGRALVYTYELSEVVPGERLVMKTAEGPFPMETTYVFSDVDGGTRMTLANRGAPTGFTSLLAPLLSSAMKAATTKDLARLKALLESAPPDR